MIQSMTGFGDATCVRDEVSYAVEIRSLNNRYLKASVRLPEELAVMEAELESLLRKRLARGSVTLSVSYKRTAATAAYEVNEAALHRYLEHLETIEKKAVGDLGRPDAVVIELASLLGLPGVVQQPDESELVAEARPVIHELVAQACDKLMAMRRSEGEGLRDDLLSHVDYIEQRLGIIFERAPGVVEEYHQRLRSRIDDLTARAELAVQEVDLVREVAIFAERCDISEELQRLRAHLEQFADILKEEESRPVGRTLDFVTQELLREANTIGSKSNNADIARMIVEIKGAIDRMKEQVQNVE
ncbi:MAG: YicC/YloC family endoribonuclease [Phycisphaeraceae bacterium]